MEEAKKLGIGVIGLFMGRCMLYVNGIKSYNSEVRAICDIDEERMKKNKEEFNTPYATTDYRELLKRSDIDIVGIFVPDHLHMQIIREALEAGKHVICTKPMVVSLDEAKETVMLVKKYGKKFLTGQTRRFVKHHIEAKNLFDSGKIGKPLFAEASYVHGDMWKVFDRGAWRYLAPQDIMYGGACHPIDHLRWYFGDVDEVFAYGCTSPVDLRYPQDKEMNFLINLKFKNGVIARVLTACGIVEPPYGATGDVMPMEGVSIFGSQGTIANYHARYFEDGDRSREKVVDFARDEDMDDFDGKEYSGHIASVLKYVKEMEECITFDKKPVINEIEGAKVIAVCSAAWESIKSGRAVKVFNEFDRL